MSHVLVAFMLTLLAGLSTGIGSCIAFVAKRTNRVFLSVSLGFSAGVMVYVSMVEIIAKAQRPLAAQLGERLGSWVAVLSFFGGIVLIAVIDKIIPRDENPHEIRLVEEKNEKILCPAAGRTMDRGLMRTGIFTALAIAIHNFPEGLATFVSALQEPEVAVPIVFAIAIHNIPEGIAVSVPIYQATGSRRRAFCYSFLSGLAEPVGALIGWLVLMPVMNDVVFGIIFAGVAGIMVFISFDELLPAARQPETAILPESPGFKESGMCGGHHSSVYGLVAGMFVMAVSLLLFI